MKPRSLAKLEKRSVSSSNLTAGYMDCNNYFASVISQQMTVQNRDDDIKNYEE